VLRIKSYSQEEIKRNYQTIRYIIGDIVNKFYVAEIEQIIEEKRITNNAIPYVLFANVTTVNPWNLWQWKEYDTNIYNFYHNSKTKKIYTITQKEIDDLRQSLVENENILFSVDKIQYGDSIIVKSGPFMGVSGTVISVKNGSCKIFVTVGLKIVTDLIINRSFLIKA